MRKKSKLILFALLMTAAIFISYPVNAYGYMETLGEVTPQGDGYLHVSGIGLTDGAFDEILFYAGNAEVYDLRSYFVMSWEEILAGDQVRVVYEGDKAFEIYVHAGDSMAADFMVVVSDNIWHEDDGCVFVTIDGKYRITLTEETQLFDSLGYEISWDDIEPGMEMFVWAAFLTASFPGQIIPDKIVLIE